MARANLLNRLTGLDRLRALLASGNVEPVLPAYQRKSRDSLITSILITLCVIYAFVSGYFLGIFQQYVLMQFLAPCTILAALALWAMPDRTGVEHRYLEQFFFSFIVINLLWPVYLAITLPGLPWLTLSKVVLLITVISFGLILASDRAARAQIGEIFERSKLIRAFLVIFVFTEFATVVVSPNIGDSMNAVVNAQFYWTSILLIMMLLAAKHGQPDRFAKSLVWAAAIMCVLAIWEYKNQRVPWANHLPSFVRVSDPTIEKMIMGGRRAGDGLYRVQTTYTTSLSLAEFMAMVAPFVIHYFLIAKRFAVRLLMICLMIAMIFTIYWTRSRLGMIGLAIAFLGYPLLTGIRRRTFIRNDLIGPSLIALYPAMLIGFVGLLMASHRLHVMFLGGGQHQASNDAREFMYTRGFSLILHHPWGYGANAGAGVLNYRDQAGNLSIDTYYLSIALDHGVIGFIAFYGMLIGAIYLAVRVYLTCRDSEARIAAPLAISLGSYLVIKSVLSQSQNQFLMYAMVGIALALNYRFYPRQNKLEQSHRWSLVRRQ